MPYRYRLQQLDGSSGVSRARRLGNRSQEDFACLCSEAKFATTSGLPSGLLFFRRHSTTSVAGSAQRNISEVSCRKSVLLLFSRRGASMSRSEMEGFGGKLDERETCCFGGFASGSGRGRVILVWLSDVPWTCAGVDLINGTVVVIVGHIRYVTSFFSNRITSGYAKTNSRTVIRSRFRVARWCEWGLGLEPLR